MKCSPQTTTKTTARIPPTTPPITGVGRGKWIGLKDFNNICPRKNRIPSKPTRIPKPRGPRARKPREPKPPKLPKEPKPLKTPKAPKEPKPSKQPKEPKPPKPPKEPKPSKPPKEKKRKEPLQPKEKKPPKAKAMLKTEKDKVKAADLAAMESIVPVPQYGHPNQNNLCMRFYRCPATGRFKSMFVNGDPPGDNLYKWIPGAYMNKTVESNSDSMESDSD